MKNSILITRTFLLKCIVILFTTSSIFIGCTDDEHLEPVPVSAKDKQVTDGLTAHARSAASEAAINFVAPLSGDQEVPANDSKASGNAIFKLRGEEIHYKLIVANIQNVAAAHIHIAPVGENGPVVVWLYPSAPPAQLIPGRSSGILATGIITADDLVGPLAGASLEDLINYLRDGGAYVNVHTAQFPGGEIRGQIKPAGRK